jgi:hypothetical protein
MRPEKFPMDTVIFTGRIPLAEFRHERPLEYQRLIQTNGLGQYEAGPASPRLFLIGSLFGFLLVGMGFFLLILIITGQFFY